MERKLWSLWQHRYSARKVCWAWKHRLLPGLGRAPGQQGLSWAQLTLCAPNTLSPLNYSQTHWCSAEVGRRPDFLRLPMGRSLATQWQCWAISAPSISLSRLALNAALWYGREKVGREQAPQITPAHMGLTLLQSDCCSDNGHGGTLGLENTENDRR